jgi:hypothetical protein
MGSEAARKLEKIQKYSVSLKRLFRFLFVVVALAMVVQTILMLTGAEPYETSARIGPMEYRGDPIPPAIRTIAWLGTTLGLAVLLKLNFHFIKLFALYSDGKLYHRETVQQIRQIGITFLLFPALWVLGVIVASVLPTQELSRTLVSSGQDPFNELLVGAIIVVVAWVMDVGRELREEQDLVI